MSVLNRLALVIALSFPASAFAEKTPRFDVDYHVSFLPTSGEAEVAIRITPGDARASRVVFTMPESRYSAVEGDGKVNRHDELVTWELPKKGGEFRYRYKIDKKRKNGAYDALITKDWTIVRGDQLVPSARITATRGAKSNAHLHLKLPAGWTHADTPWLETDTPKVYHVDNDERSLARPTGWMIAGDIGTRRDVIEGMEISVAAPKGLFTPRMDLMAMLTATTPVFLDAFGNLPPKLLIVRGEDPMWRGGLSGPRSLWMHADRPLISENGSSTLMHEVVHVITRIRAVEGDDWITEGIAEYYGMEALRRAGLLSQARFDKSLEWMRRHGKDIKTLKANNSAGPRTARAVVLFAALDQEIQKKTAGKESLDAVARDLMREGERISLDDLTHSVEHLLGGPSSTLKTSLLK